MRKALVPAFLLVLGGVILGATVFREQLVHAATTPFQQVIVTNTNTNPVPVAVQNADASGTLKVHEQGTANVSVQGTPDVNVTNPSSSPVPVAEQGTADVNVTNTSLPVDITNSSLSVAPPSPVTGGGHSFVIDGGVDESLQGTYTASALVIHMSSGVASMTLFDKPGEPADFIGPASGGNSDIVLALQRPVSFNEIQCNGGGSENCAVSFIGNAP
jgi:hypothetical protein